MAQKITETLLKRNVKDMRVNLAERLYRLRQENDFSQARLAEIAGVDRKTINRIALFWTLKGSPCNSQGFQPTAVTVEKSPAGRTIGNPREREPD